MRSSISGRMLDFSTEVQPGARGVTQPRVAAWAAGPLTPSAATSVSWGVLLGRVLAAISCRWDFSSVKTRIQSVARSLFADLAGTARVLPPRKGGSSFPDGPGKAKVANFPFSPGSPPDLGSVAA